MRGGGGEGRGLCHPSAGHPLQALGCLDTLPPYASQHPCERVSHSHLQRGKLRHQWSRSAKGQRQDLLCAPLSGSHPPVGAGHPSPTLEIGKTEAREGRVSWWLCCDGVRSPPPTRTWRSLVCKRGTDSPGSRPLCKDHTSPAEGARGTAQLPPLPARFPPCRRREQGAHPKHAAPTWGNG